MNRTTFRTFLFGALLVPLALLGVAGQASASVEAHAAHFSGGFTTSCSLVSTAEDGLSGTYTCTHTAASTVCTFVLVAGDLTATKGGLCSATLEGSTSGAWSAPSSKAVYRCENGGGSGVLYYQPTPADRKIPIQVALNVVPSTQVITFNGYYVDPTTGQTLIARGTLKSVCSTYTSSSVGFDGDISPV
jgi:hypothetical protein